MQARTTVIIGLVIAMNGAMASATEVFRWVDDDGVVNFSDAAPASDDVDTSVIRISTSTPLDYDPQEDPYSILNQSDRIHDLWSDLQAQKTVEQATAPRREPEARTFVDDDRHFLPGLAFNRTNPFLFRDRSALALQRQQQRVLDEVDRRALPPGRSINSSFRRARVEARREAVDSQRRRQPGPRRPRGER